MHLGVYELYKRTAQVIRRNSRALWDSALLFWRVFEPRLWMLQFAAFIAVAIASVVVRTAHKHYINNNATITSNTVLK